MGDETLFLVTLSSKAFKPHKSHKYNVVLTLTYTNSNLIYAKVRFWDWDWDWDWSLWNRSVRIEVLEFVCVIVRKLNNECLRDEYVYVKFDM